MAKKKKKNRTDYGGILNRGTQWFKDKKKYTRKQKHKNKDIQK